MKAITKRRRKKINSTSIKIATEARKRKRIGKENKTKIVIDTTRKIAVVAETSIKRRIKRRKIMIMIAMIADLVHTRESTAEGMIDSDRI